MKIKRIAAVMLTVLWALFSLSFIEPVSGTQGSPTDNGANYPEIASKSTLEFESKYNDRVFVIDDGEFRSLVFGSTHSRATQSKVLIKDPARLVFHYTECSLIGLSLFRNYGKEVKNVLMIGLGGGSLPRFIKKYYPHADIDNVEIDPLIAAIAKKYFFVKESPTFRIFVEDGRKFIERTSKKYDIILLDAFGADADIPRQLTSFEFLGLMKSHLRPGGIVITNYINHEQKKYESFVATYRRAFRFVMRFNLEKFDYTNVILISFDDTSKNFDSQELIRRADGFSKWLGNEYELRKYAALYNKDILKENRIEIIHDN